jgi:hypothetical protein
MKPEPPKRGRDSVGQAGTGNRDHLEPRAADQVSAIGDRDDNGGGQPGRDASEDPVADLFGHNADRVVAGRGLVCDLYGGEGDQ